MELIPLVRIRTTLKLVTILALCLCCLGQGRPLTTDNHHRHLHNHHRDSVEGSADVPADSPSADMEPESLDSADGDDNDVGTDGEGTVPAQKGEEFHSVPMPTDFKSYDIITPDGYISLDELIHVTGAVENVREAFTASDANGDGRLTQAEFYTAPWMLGGDLPTDDDVVPPGDSAANNVHVTSSKARDESEPMERPSDDVTGKIMHSRRQDDVIKKT